MPLYTNDFSIFLLTIAFMGENLMIFLGTNKICFSCPLSNNNSPEIVFLIGDHVYDNTDDRVETSNCYNKILTVNVLYEIW